MILLDRHPILFSIEGVNITAHGLFFILGVLGAYLVLKAYVSRYSMNSRDLFFNVVLIFFAGIVAARIGFALVYPSEFHSLAEFFAIWEGGLLSYTGIVGGLLAIQLLYGSKPIVERLEWFDAFGLVALFGWSIGRLGNYYAGDSGGVQSAYWSVFYGHIPIQLFESVFCLVLFFILLNLSHKKQLRPGALVVFSIGGYALGRMVIDFWRDESRILFFHVSQWAALLIFIITVVIWLRTRNLE